MIPISDQNPSRHVPAVNWTLIAINIIVFLFELTLPARQLNRLMALWGAVPNDVLFALANPVQTPSVVWFSMITSQFLHAGLAHIIGNMLFLGSLATTSKMRWDILRTCCSISPVASPRRSRNLS